MNDTHISGGPNAVYVQTNTSPNEVIAFRRSDDGSLNRIGSVATGGKGSDSPHLQSQGSVVLTGDGQHLLVTNAGSDDLSVFAVASDGSLALRSRVDTGSVPRSVAGNREDADPAQVGFSPDGSLVVITQRGTDSIVTYAVAADGTFGDSQEIASEGPTPYG